MNTTAGRLAEIERRLGDGVFTWSKAVPLAGGGVADLVASRTFFSWKGLVVFSQHLVVRAIVRPTVDDVAALLTAGLAVGKARNRVPLPRGLQFGYMILPIIVADQITQPVLDAVCAAPRKRFAVFDLPAVCESATGNVHYFRGTPVRGAFFASDLRAVIETYVAPPGAGPVAARSGSSDRSRQRQAFGRGGGGGGGG